MLDLRKYEIRAEADPDFEERLLQNANQAIKDEFGEDLPYKLKCREKLVFEVEPMEGLLSDDSWENVAGGAPPKKEVGYCFDGGIFDNEPAIPQGFVPEESFVYPPNAYDRFMLIGPKAEGSAGFVSYFLDEDGPKYSHSVKLIGGTLYINPVPIIRY